MADDALGEALTALADAVDTGRMSAAEAQAATRTRVVPLMTLESLNRAARAESDRAIEASSVSTLTWWHMLFAAIERTDSDGRDALERAAALPYLYVTSCMLSAVPDGRVFTDARVRGEAAFDSAVAAGETFWASEALHRLGVLHLDPFVIGRSAGNFAVEDRMWRGRLADVLGPQVASEPEAAMPDSADALTRAQDYLDRALAVRRGPPRGFTLKALCNVVMWRERLGGPADHARIVAMAEEALTLLPEEFHAEMTAFAAHYSGGNAGPDATETLLAEDPAAMFERLGARSALDRIRILTHSALEEAPTIVCGVILNVWPLIGDDGFAPDRLRLATTFGSACLNLAQEEGCVLTADMGLDAIAQRLGEAAAAGGWSMPYTVAVQTGLAMSTQPLDREAEAAPALTAMAEAVGEQGQAALRDVIALLAAGLWQCAGVNAYNAGDLTEAAASYIKACVAHVLEGQIEPAVQALDLAEDCAVNGDTASLMIRGLAVTTAALARRGAAPMAGRLRRMWERAIGRAFGIGEPAHAADLPTILIALQAAKGAALAMRIAGGGDYDWRQDTEALAMLDAIAALRPAAPPPPAPGRIEDSVLLASYDSAVGSEEPGDLGRLLRLEERFDAHLARRAFDSDSMERALIDDGELRALIGADTVLVSQYVGRTAHGMLAILTVLLTDTETYAAVGAGALPAGVITLSADGREAAMNWFTLPVAAARDAILADPEDGPVSHKGAEALSGLNGQVFGGGLMPRLAELRAAGKTHLCFHPHDAFHVLPLHLLGEGATLADDWTVSTVPHVAALRPRDAGKRAGLMPVTALGLGYADGVPHGQDELAGAEDEAHAVAAALGGHAWVGTAATEARFVAALTGSRRVHVACHGGMAVGAPAFQRLFLMPGEGADGIVHAYEVDGLDLSHLDLVTLSACETALGRFDALDNLRGMSANLFAAGAATIVSTLWPVLDEAAAAFFPHLYARLAAGDGKRAAFWAAQVATRARFPEYRDWGAFQYAGRW